MSYSKKTPKEQLLSIADELLDDLLQASEEEILADAAEDPGDMQAEIKQTEAVIQQAISQSGKRRLAIARKALDTKSRSVSGATVLTFPLVRKRQIIQSLSMTGLTLAARNGQEQTESDLNSLLEDLIELGEIDQEGNPT